MTCLQPTVFLPVKVTTWTTLTVFLLSLMAGFGQTGACRPFCAGNYCMTLNQDRMDFKSAEEACQDRSGELMTFQTKTDKNIFDAFTEELHGNFWIGLCLPAGTCSNLSAPLRDYKWTSGSVLSSFIPTSFTWTDNIQVCSPHCVSLSSDRQLTERLCSDRTDGYLCKMKHKDACQTRRLESPVFQSAKGCSAFPCEHHCTDIKGGYKCSCFRGYIPDRNDPHLCRIFCSEQKCPAVCQRHADSSCFCPDGFLMVPDGTRNVCEDIDECSHGWCDQKCKNTFGGFVCSCGEGFVLNNQVKCIKAAHNGSTVVATPTAIGSVRPAANNTFTGSSAAAGGFIWVWIFLSLAVIVLIIVIRFYVVRNQRNRGQNVSQQSTEPVDNREC